MLCFNKEGQVFTFLACASCFEHPKYVEQVGAKQEAHSSLFDKNQAGRKHPVQQRPTLTPRLLFGSLGSEIRRFLLNATCFDVN